MLLAFAVEKKKLYKFWGDLTEQQEAMLEGLHKKGRRTFTELLVEFGFTEVELSDFIEKAKDVCFIEEKEGYISLAELAVLIFDRKNQRKKS